MRAPALLLLLALTGPGMADVVCGLACAQHRHHVVSAAGRPACHEHESAGPSATWAVGVPCHDRLALNLPSEAPSPHPVPTPAVRAVPVMLVPSLDRAATAPLDARIRPPDILPISTSLRI